MGDKDQTLSDTENYAERIARDAQILAREAEALAAELDPDHTATEALAGRTDWDPRTAALAGRTNWYLDQDPDLVDAGTVLVPLNPYLTDTSAREGSNTIPLINKNTPIVHKNEEEDHYICLIEMPGYPSDNLEFRYANMNIIISAEPLDDFKDFKDSFQEKIFIPDMINERHIDATYRCGILKLTLPIVSEEESIIDVNIESDRYSE